MALHYYYLIIFNSHFGFLVEKADVEIVGFS